MTGKQIMELCYVKAIQLQVHPRILFTCIKAIGLSYLSSRPSDASSIWEKACYNYQEYFLDEKRKVTFLKDIPQEWLKQIEVDLLIFEMSFPDELPIKAVERRCAEEVEGAIIWLKDEMLRRFDWNSPS